MKETLEMTVNGLVKKGISITSKLSFCKAPAPVSRVAIQKLCAEMKW